jgi:hypothetical protein
MLVVTCLIAFQSDPLMFTHQLLKPYGRDQHLCPCTIQTSLFFIGKISIIDGYEKKFKELANIG